MAATRARPLIALLGIALLLLNFQLFLALLPPLAVLFLLPPFIGLPAALCVAAILADSQEIVGAARTTPWAPTPAEDLGILLQRVNRSDGTFLELGSGDGRNLVLAVRAGFSKATGLELSPALVALSRLRIWWAGVNAVVHRANVHTAPLPADADAVYLYLSAEALATLAPRLACTYGGRGQRAVLVLTRDFELPGWGPPVANLTHGRTRLMAWEARRAQRGSTCHTEDT